jgi:tyrosyl-tRNA synthetase
MRSDIFTTLASNCLQILKPEELQIRLEANRPLRVKFGVDPTTPDIHLGHTIALDKLRQFQEAGHDSILIMGDFTATVGDPSGRSISRPKLTYEEIMSNALTYQKQVFKILDQEQTHVVFNSKWFRTMSLEKIIHLNSLVTIQKILRREDFRDRINQGFPIRLHEVQYPIMQGWDSVQVLADIELGGTDQLFNIMVGRHLQKEEGLLQQIAMLLPLLEGMDGIQKMSKSLNNAIGIAETPEAMFGKLMSIPDAITGRYYELLLRDSIPSSSIHPMDAKKELARRIVSKYHSWEAARIALESFNLRFGKRNLEGLNLPPYSLAKGKYDPTSIVISVYSRCFGIHKSRGAVRRLIEQGSVRWRGEKISDPHVQFTFDSSGILKLDRTHAVRLSV